MDELFADADPARAPSARCRRCFSMRKLDIAALRAAADGVPAA